MNTPLHRQVAKSQNPFRLNLQIGIGSDTDFKMSVAAAATAAKSLQLCLTLCDPIDGSLPGFSVPGILQARTLERK